MVGGGGEPSDEPGKCRDSCTLTPMPLRSTSAPLCLRVASALKSALERRPAISGHLEFMPDVPPIRAFTHALCAAPFAEGGSCEAQNMGVTRRLMARLISGPNATGPLVEVRRAPPVPRQREEDTPTTLYPPRTHMGLNPPGLSRKEGRNPGRSRVPARHQGGDVGPQAWGEADQPPRKGGGEDRGGGRVLLAGAEPGLGPVQQECHFRRKASRCLLGPGLHRASSII